MPKGLGYMADVLTKTQRSFNMSRIRSGETKPEVRLRELLQGLGMTGFKERVTNLAGKPDFYLPQYEAVIFLDGCFWHKCKQCFKRPVTNREFWDKKISGNIERDKKVSKQLTDQGLRVIRIWEHEIKKADQKFAMGLKQKIENNTKKIKVLDLFAGAGGFSEGFFDLGCEVVGHIEMDPQACDTIRTRILYHALKKNNKLGEYKDYLLGKITRDSLISKYDLQNEVDSVMCEKITKENCKSLITKVKTRLKGENLDIIIGGPPCQAYSYIGRARDKNRMQTDERNYLYEHYVKFLRALKPKIFVFENVPGLLTAGDGKYLKDMQALMKKAGYQTDYKILDASAYGVPQSRRRVILIGWSKESKIKAYPEPKPVERAYTVGTFLNKLPKIQAGEALKPFEYSGSEPILKQLGITNPEVNVLEGHVARPHTVQDKRIYRIAVKEKNKGNNIHYASLPAKLKTHNNEISFPDRFKVVNSKSNACQTVVAHIAKDGHHYIHPDIIQNRSLTVREAARLQTFPDDFKFEGSRSAQYKQIGNAVPPMLSRIIARLLINNL